MQRRDRKVGRNEATDEELWRCGSGGSVTGGKGQIETECMIHLLLMGIIHLYGSSWLDNIISGRQQMAMGEHIYLIDPSLSFLCRLH